MKLRAGRDPEGAVYVRLDDLVAVLTQAPPDVQADLPPSQAFKALARGLERWSKSVPRGSGLIIVDGQTKFVPGS